MIKKYSIEDMCILADNREGQCLSEKYLGVKSKLEWKCTKGHIWKATPDMIIRGKWCPYCAGNARLTIDEMQIIAAQKGGKCLSEKYVNDITKLRWQCNEGHIWEATPNNVKFKSWCPVCGGSKKLNIKDMHRIALERGGKCLSKKYINTDSKLKWQCGEDHTWEAVPNSIKRGSWCPVCSEGLGERICRVYFEQIFKKKFPKYRPKWLINADGNQMELDGYSKSLKLAFEHQGEQHIRHLERFHTKEEFNKRKRDDKDKSRLCKKYNVTLIMVPEIPEFLKLKQVKNFIINECSKLNFEKLPKGVENLHIDLKQAYISNASNHLKTIKKISKERGGKCLSGFYLGNKFKLEFQCSEGHIWKATPSHIKNGTWCPICGGKTKASIDEMRSIAKERGGECISDKYINDRTKLTWKCQKSHIWRASPSNIKRGKWCPHCAGNFRKTIKDMHVLASKRGGRCLSKKYINTDSKLKWQCEKGHIWKATPSSIKKRTWCPICGGTVKKTIKDMHVLASKRGGRCLSSRYINAKTKLEWCCDKGHTWKATPDNIVQKRWCPYCAGKRKFEGKEG